MAARGDIEINGVGYALARLDSGELIRRNQVEQFAEVLRNDGQQDRSQIRSFQTIAWPNVSLGHGRSRIDSDSAFTPSEFRRFFDSDGCITWYPHDIRLPLLEVDSAETGLEVIRASAQFKGELWSVWEDDTSTDVVARNYTGSSSAWENGGTLFNSPNLQVALDIIQYKTGLVGLLAGANISLQRTIQGYESTDGASWADVTLAVGTYLGRDYLADAIVVHENSDFGLLAEIGGEAVAAMWHEAAGTITFSSVAAIGGAWVDEAVDIASGNGPQGIATYPGLDNADKLYVGTREGLYEVDTSPSTWTFNLVYPMPASNDNCRRMTVHNGALWFAVGVNDDSPAPMVRMTVDGDRRIFESDVGLNVGDGLPSDALGPVRWMKSANEFLFASVGGGKAGRQARIFIHNGRGWHTIRKHGTANQKIEWIEVSGEDDATPRLHYSVRTATAVSNTKHIDQPLVNPNSGVALNYEASGFVTLPYVDKGLPLESAAFLRAGVNAVDLSSSDSGEYIEVFYGEDDGSGGLNARTNTLLGDILSGTKALDWASLAGLSSVNMGLHLVLHRDAGNTTDTPKLKDVEINHLPHIKVLTNLECIVDIQESAALQQESEETVLTNLATARDSVTLVAVDYPGGFASTRMKISLDSSRESIRRIGAGQPMTQGTGDAQARRMGVVAVTASEVIR